ncbi:MAG: MoxR-like ATPase [Natronomonas sp.]|jgi:MoxR-like ATPase
MTDTTDTQAPAPGLDSADVETAGRTARRVIENVQDVIVGNDEAIEHLITALLGGGHVLLEDVPGVGKTMLARAVAASFDCSFKRVQFTPDLLPTDITGANVYNRKENEFEFRPGPVFANVVLADEINRAPPKTQAALLEAMEEEQATVDGTTHPMPDPFAVIATQNAVERERTYELPAAELDRFMLKLRLGYPDHHEEAEVIDRAVGSHAIDDIAAVADIEALRTARAITGDVEVRKPLREYVTRLAAYTRDHARLGASPRGSIALVRAAQGRAVLDSRGYVIPDDVQAAAPVVFPHRMRTEPGAADPEDLVAEALETVPVEE